MDNKIVTEAVKKALIKAHLSGKSTLDLNSLLERYHDLHEPFVYVIKRDTEKSENKSLEDIKKEYDLTSSH